VDKPVSCLFLRNRLTSATFAFRFDEVFRESSVFIIVTVFIFITSRVLFTFFIVFMIRNQYIRDLHYILTLEFQHCISVTDVYFCNHITMPRPTTERQKKESLRYWEEWVASITQTLPGNIVGGTEEKSKIFHKYNNQSPDVYTNLEEGRSTSCAPYQ
jgi:hypothetical protein